MSPTTEQHCELFVKQLDSSFHSLLQSDAIARSFEERVAVDTGKRWCTLEQFALVQAVGDPRFASAPRAGVMLGACTGSSSR